VSLSSNSQQTLRPANVIVCGWVAGKQACVNLAGVSPLVGLRTETFIEPHIALQDVSSN
jgi:hypothetical protein